MSKSILTRYQFILLFQLHQLYVEVLYTIHNKLGASCPQFSHFKEELLVYVQEAFGVNKKLHEQLLTVATDEKVCKLLLDKKVMLP